MSTQNNNKKTVELIDWLSVTYPPKALSGWFPSIDSAASLQVMLKPLTRDKSRFIRSQARYGYSYGWLSDNGTIVYADLKSKGQDWWVGALGIHIVYPGSALNGLENHLALLGMHLNRGAKVRRIDLARDC